MTPSNDLNLSHSLKTELGLKLTPEMRLKIEVLSAARMDLRDIFDKEEADNPLIESVEWPEQDESGNEKNQADFESSPEFDGDETEEYRAGPKNPVDSVPDAAYEKPNEATEDIASATVREGFEELSGSQYEGLYEPESADRSGAYESEYNPEIGKLNDFTYNSIHAEEKKDLHSELIRQLNSLNIDDGLYPVLVETVHYVNQKGFIEETPEQIASDKNIDVKTAAAAIEFIKTLEPAGVGASSARESLMIQLRMKKKQDTLAYRLIENCFDMMAKQQYQKIAAFFKVKEDDVKKTLEDIKELSPYPGMNYSVNEARSVVPDIIVTAENGEFVIEMAGETPEVRQNTSMIKQFGAKPETKEFIKGYENRIKTLMTALAERNKTIKAVVETIIEVQKDYLKNEKGEMKPLILKEIAGKTDLSESTISRIVSNKYIQMPYGVLPLKAFFSSKLNVAGGGVVSSNSVRDRIASIIENEDKSAPLTDTQIAEILNNHNIKISRRTVTKYREQLEILPAVVRKK